jgi:hypothetical protein
MASSEQAAGALGETIATARLLRRGYTVLCPGAPEPYDFVAVRRGGAYIRIQVKATACSRPHGQGMRYSFALKYARNQHYPKDSVDFFICVALDTESCWVLPAAAATVKSLKINARGGGKWNKYFEAWHLID